MTDAEKDIVEREMSETAAPRLADVSSERFLATRTSEQLRAAIKKGNDLIALLDYLNATDDPHLTFERNSKNYEVWANSFDERYRLLVLSGIEMSTNELMRRGEKP